MTPLWLAAPALVALVLLGYALLACAGARTPGRTLALGDLVLAAGVGLAAAHSLWLAPFVTAPALAALVVLARFSRGPRAPSSSSSSARAPALARSTRLAPPAMVALATLAALAQPATPTYWDEFVWLAKSRVECAHWGALRDAALAPAGGLVPAGYPLLWSLAAAWFGALRDRPDALYAGAVCARLLALALYVLALARLTPRSPRAALTACALVALTPLALVHLRSVHADLPVGLLAAAGALALGTALTRASQAPRAYALAAASFACAAGLKDEGAAHALAALIAALVAHRGRLARRHVAPLALVAAAAFAPALLWRAMLALSGLRNADHALGAPPSLDSVRTLARSALAHAADLTSWGALPALVLSYALYRALGHARALVGPRRPRGLLVVRDRIAAQLALTLALQTLAVFLGVTLGSEPVREFAREGTLWNRLGMQLVPVAAALLARALGRTLAPPSAPAA